MEANKLIQEYKRKGHPLGEELTLEECENLIRALRQRLQATEQELDLSPMSLKRLDQRLRIYFRLSHGAGQALFDNEVVQVVRELAAYFGMVLVKHVGAIWRGGSSLWGTEIEVSGPTKVIKGRTPYTIDGPQVLALGNLAAAALNRAANDKDTELYSRYLAARKRIAKQRLS
jgi:hypothetical protein